MAHHGRVGFTSAVNETTDKITSATNDFLQQGPHDNPKIIGGSIRQATIVGDAFAAGAHIVTVPPDIMTAMLFSQRTIETMQQFDEAWVKMQKK